MMTTSLRKKKDDIVSKMNEFPRIIQFSQKIVREKRDGGEKNI